MQLEITPLSLKSWRKDNKLTQAQLGAMIGLDNVTIAKIETGKRGISHAEAKLLAMHMQASQGTRLEFTEDEWADITRRAFREGYSSPQAWITAKIRGYLAMDKSQPNTLYTPQIVTEAQCVAEIQKPYGEKT